MSKRCKAYIKSGRRCKNAAGEDGYCHIESHQEQADILDAEWAEGLTNKQRRFVEEFCIDYNATQAAIRAGYSKKTAKEQGYQLLHKPSLSQAIQSYMDLCSMKAAEIIKRLTDMGRASAAHFLQIGENGDMRINLGSDQAAQNIHLLKKVKQTERIIPGEGDSSEIERRTEFEIHDAKDALKQLSKIRGIEAPQKHEHTGKDGGPIESTNKVVFYLPDNGRDSD